MLTGLELTMSWCSNIQITVLKQRFRLHLTRMIDLRLDVNFQSCYGLNRPSLIKVSQLQFYMWWERYLTISSHL